MSIARTFVGDQTCDRAMAFIRKGESAFLGSGAKPGSLDALMAPHPTNAASSAHDMKSLTMRQSSAIGRPS
jgi:hypothetical protein